MKIMVPVRRVPNPDVKVRLKKDGSGIEAEGVNFLINSFDEFAIEEAVRLTEKDGGEVFMVSAMTGFIMSNKFDDLGWWEGAAFIPAILLTVIVCVLVSTATAIITERVAYRPLRGSPRLIPLITSIGVSFFIQNAVLLLFGLGSKTYPSNPDWLEETLPWLGIEVKKLVVIIVAAISMAGLWYFVERTKTGKAMRAVADVIDTILSG